MLGGLGACGEPDLGEIWPDKPPAIKPDVALATRDCCVWPAFVWDDDEIEIFDGGGVDLYRGELVSAPRRAPTAP